MTDEEIVRRLRDGDEATFTMLVERYHRPMVRVARAYVSDEATAEEIAQDAWLAVLNGLTNFQGRGSLKSWIFSIVCNKAKTRGVRDARSTAFSALASQEAASHDPAVPADRFQGPDGRYPDHWAHPPAGWGENPEQRLLQKETLSVLQAAIETLPTAQRTVITLRDLAGQDTESVCNVLGITETNMRVLLHRARSKVRAQMERYFAGSPASGIALS